MPDNFFGEVIYAYTRAEALADGVLHDISETASEFGFIYPVHIAQYAWAELVKWSPDDTSQDQTGPAWAVLIMARQAVKAEVRRGNKTVGPIRFTVERFTESGQPEPEPIRLEIELGPGDQGEPVFTITADADR